MRRYFIQLLAIGAVLLAAPVANADLGDQLFKLLASDGAAGDLFGLPVATNGTTAIVGAPLDDDNGTVSGSVYFFDTATGTQVAKLLPTDGAQGDLFGFSVAISGTTAIVGAYGDSDNGIHSGSAYLFDTTTGSQIAKLLPSNGDFSDDFGWSVAISGTTAIVGAIGHRGNGGQSGSAYLFDTTTGLQITELPQADGTEGDHFGFSVAISGTRVIIGAWGDNDNGFDSGSAYLFDTNTGAQIAKFVPADGAQNDRFGWSVAINGTTAFVGALFDDDNGTDSGSVYLFDTNTGAQIAKLLPADGSAGDRFGSSLALSGATVIIGADADDDNGIDSGSAYLFDTITSSQIAKLLPIDGEAQDIFGTSVAINEGTALVGARMDADNGIDSGSAYLFDAGSSAETSATLTGFTVFTGTLLNGDLIDLESSNDSYIHTRSGFGANLLDLHNMEMRISATTTVQAPATLDLTIESRINQPAGIAQIGLLNQTNGRIEFIGQYVLFSTDTIDRIPAIDATNFVTGTGDIELSIKHLVFVPFLAFTFESFIDHAEIVVR